MVKAKTLPGALREVMENTPDNGYGNMKQYIQKVFGKNIFNKEFPKTYKNVKAAFSAAWVSENMRARKTA